ncbi:hypothetical protein [Mycolicibacterium sp. YH-1]|uniref:hypothetical protein n=1 Tax=Mycolicibacterium sp. YH-1 TaxID=2908837 RepID=UPI00352D2913
MVAIAEHIHAQGWTQVEGFAGTTHHPAPCFRLAQRQVQQVQSDAPVNMLPAVGLRVETALQMLVTLPSAHNRLCLGNGIRLVVSL